MRVIGVWGAALTAAASLVAGEVSAQAAVSSAMRGGERTCTARTRVDTTFDADAATLPPPEVTNDLRALTLTPRADGGFDIEQRSGEGDALVVLKIRTDGRGETVAAEIGGPGMEGVEADMGAMDRDALARAAAVDVPERLLIGRSFRPGDPYYPPGAADAVIAGLARSFGLPEGTDFTADMRSSFEGVSTVNGRTVMTWSGVMTMKVRLGDVSGDARFEYRMVHDQETGLVIEAFNDGVLDFSQGGRRAKGMRIMDAYGCRITAR